MRTFLTIWFGQVTSVIGSGMTSFALGVWIIEQTGEATPFVLIAIFNSIPTFALSPIAGAIVDRWNRRRVMIGADVGSALVTVALLVLFVSGALLPWHLYVSAFISSVLNIFQNLAYTTSVTSLVSKQHYGRANAMVQTAQSFGFILAPILGASLYALTGLNGIFTIDLATFAVAVGTLLLVRIPQAARDESKDPTTVIADIHEGFAYVRTRPGLIGLAIMIAMVNLLISASIVLSSPMILGFSTVQVLGLVQGISSIGLLLGGLAVSAWGGPSQRVLGITLGAIASGIGLAIVGLRPNPILIGVGFFLFMLPITLVNSSIRAIVQSKVPGAIQGRVFSLIFMIARAGAPLGLLAAGPLADRVFEPAMALGGSLAAGPLGDLLGSGPGRGIGLMLFLSGLGMVLVALAMYSYPRLRFVEREMPDVDEDE